MPFVNELISDKDFVEYKIAEIDEFYLVGGTRRRDWTIDKERNIYLRQVATGRWEESEESTWTFFWGGQLLEVKIQHKGTEKLSDGTYLGKKRLLSIDIPPYLEGKRSEIIADLIDAFSVYKNGGYHAVPCTYVSKLEV